MCVNICLHVCKPWKPEEGIERPRTGATEGCEPPCGCTSLLTVTLSLWLLQWLLKNTRFMVQPAGHLSSCGFPVKLLPASGGGQWVVHLLSHPPWMRRHGFPSCCRQPQSTFCFGGFASSVYFWNHTHDFLWMTFLTSSCKCQGSGSFRYKSTLLFMADWHPSEWMEHILLTLWKQ